MHEGYLGWNSGSPLPSSKAESSKWMKHFWNKRKVTIYEIKPVGIGVFGDVAVVHYYYTMMVANEEGKEKDMNGNWTDVLMKQGDKWVLIGDHGGNSDDD
jgi:ketosteroid isomerase-like protein